MSYRLSASWPEGRVTMEGRLAETPREAGSDVERLLSKGATVVEVEQSETGWGLPPGVVPLGEPGMETT